MNSVFTIAEAQRRNAVLYRAWAAVSRGKTKKEWQRLAETAERASNQAMIGGRRL